MAADLFGCHNENYYCVCDRLVKTYVEFRCGVLLDLLVFFLEFPRNLLWKCKSFAKIGIILITTDITDLVLVSNKICRLFFSRRAQVSEEKSEYSRSFLRNTDYPWFLSWSRLYFWLEISRSKVLIKKKFKQSSISKCHYATFAFSHPKSALNLPIASINNSPSNLKR